MSRQIPWPRILAEGFAILVSILLAFGIQAWWEGRQENRQRAELVAALTTDFETTRARIANSVARADSMISRTDGYLQAVAAPRSIPQDSARYLMNGATSRLVFAGALANYEASIQSGSLRLIESAPLIEALAEFRQAQEFFDGADEIHGEFFYLGPLMELRRELGSFRALGGDGNNITGTNPLPAGLVLSEDDFWAFVGSPRAYATVETARTLIANKRRGLVDMDAAAVRVLDVLSQVR